MIHVTTIDVPDYTSAAAIREKNTYTIKIGISQ